VGSLRGRVGLKCLSISVELLFQVSQFKLGDVSARPHTATHKSARLGPASAPLRARGRFKAAHPALIRHRAGNSGTTSGRRRSLAAAARANSRKAHPCRRGRSQKAPSALGFQKRQQSQRRRSNVSAPGRATRPALFDDAKAMKTATFNLNGVNSRLPVLLRRLQETSPDASCRLPGGDTSFQRFLRVGVCFFLRRERHF
jgi:hypothetical protein